MKHSIRRLFIIVILLVLFAGVIACFIWSRRFIPEDNNLEAHSIVILYEEGWPLSLPFALFQGWDNAIYISADGLRTQEYRSQTLWPTTHRTQTHLTQSDLNDLLQTIRQSGILQPCEPKPPATGGIALGVPTVGAEGNIKMIIRLDGTIKEIYEGAPDCKNAIDYQKV